MKIGTVIGLAAVAAILAAAAQYTERRSVPAWAPNAAIAAKPALAEAAAVAPDVKVQAALPAAGQPVAAQPAATQPASTLAALPAPSSEIPAASRRSTVDSDTTGGLPKEPEGAAQVPAPEVSPAPAPAPRQARPARPARAPEPAASRPAPVRDPIQFRLAEGNR